jgi:tetratricopeptide (TPR) repeat protein
MCRALLLTAVSLVSSLAAFSTPCLAQTTDDDAIKAVVRAETAAFYAGDQTAWAATWAHDTDVSRALVTNGQYEKAIGWDKVIAQTAEFMKGMSAPVQAEFADENVVIRGKGDMAAVEYEQATTLPVVQPGTISHTREYRVLVKRDGAWKILSQVTIASDTFGDTPEAVEARLNNDGYMLLNAKKPMEAVEVFKLVVKLYPQSWNAYDSLGEAYGVAGDKAAAIENYEKSLQLNPKNENGRAALAKLKER